METQKAKTPRKAWGVCLLILFSASAGSICLFNVPPAAAIVGPLFNIDAVGIGLLVSSLSIASVVAAFPAGWLSDKFGLKAVVVISAGVTALGAVLACFAGSNFGYFVFCRVLMGIGLGLYQVVWPPLISMWFPEHTRGTATGILGAYAGIGTIIDLNVIPRILDHGYQFILVLTAVYSVVALLVVVVLKMKPEVNYVELEARGKVLPKESSWIDLFKTPTAWMIAIVFFVFAWICAGGVNTYYPVYLTTTIGIDSATANSMVSICSGLSLLSFIVGFVMDRIGSRKRWMIIFGFFYLIGVLIMFSIPSIPAIWVGIFMEGIACAGIPVCVRTLACENLPAGMINKALALITFCTTLGIAFGATGFAALAEATSYGVAGQVMLGGLAFISLVCSFFIKEAKRIKASVEN